MQVFKAALRIFFQHRVYVSIYLVALSFMGVLIGMAAVDNTQPDFVEGRPEITVIDRDGSPLSLGLTEFLAAHTELKKVEDDRKALQDAVAQNYVQYIVIIPENFGEDFIAAEKAGKDAPGLETVVSYESIAANMMNGLVDEFLATTGVYISSATGDDISEIIELTSADLSDNATVVLAHFSESSPVSLKWLLYMKFVSYTILVSIVVCTGVTLTAFNRTEIRRRNLGSPNTTVTMNIQLAAACGVICLIAWAWTVLVGLAFFGHALVGVSPPMIILTTLALLALSLVGLTLGFLIGQVTQNEVALNSGGNVVCMVMTFFGGVWIPLDLVAPEIGAIARFDPVFYYNDIVDLVAALPDFSAASLSAVFADIGIILLFSVALFSIALVIGKLRGRTVEAGGNAAAARPAVS